MNIFYLDSDPKLAAQMLCDKHVVKMTLETAQLLCTAHHVLGAPGSALEPFSSNPLVPYRPTHKNHPQSVWVRSSVGNYQWLGQYFHEIAIEYTHRYKKQHLAYIRCKHLADTPPLKISYEDFSEPYKCMPDVYKVESTIESYRNYYRIAKRDIIKYTNRDIPLWLT